MPRFGTWPAVAIILLLAATAGIVYSGTVIAIRPGGSVLPNGDPVPVRYDLDMSWAPADRVLAGSESIHFRDSGPGTLPTIWLRLWPNDSIPGQADGCTNPGITLRHVIGATVAGYATACSAVSLRLRHQLTAGESASVSFAFTVSAPEDNDLFGRSLGIDLFGNVVPVMAVRDSQGWHLNSDSDVGDAAFTLSAAWHATIRVPARLAIASTGAEASNRVLGSSRVVIAETEHARDFAFAIGPMTYRSADVDGIRVRVFSSSATSTSDSRHALAVAASALKTYVQWYGTYGSREFDLVITNLPYYGMEYPEIVFSAPDTATVAHEVAHQWFYGIVGDDQYGSPWLDESFASWNEEQFAPGTYPCDPKQPLGNQRGRLGLGLTYFSHHPDQYTNVVYRGGSCALTALEHMLGRRTFLRLLHQEVSLYRYGVIHTPDFLRLLTATNRSAARRWMDLTGLQ